MLRHPEAQEDTHTQIPSSTDSVCLMLWLFYFRILFILCVWLFVCMRMCVPHAFLVTLEDRTRHQIPGTGLTVVSHHVHTAWTWVLHKNSSALNGWACSPGPSVLMFKDGSKRKGAVAAGENTGDRPYHPSTCTGGDVGPWGGSWVIEGHMKIVGGPGLEWWISLNPSPVSPSCGGSWVFYKNPGQPRSFTRVKWLMSGPSCLLPDNALNHRTFSVKQVLVRK